MRRPTRQSQKMPIAATTAVSTPDQAETVDSSIRRGRFDGGGGAALESRFGGGP
jgi:hypothetical protein